MEKMVIAMSGAAVLGFMLVSGRWRIKQKRQRLRWNRERFIREYSFPTHLDDSLLRAYPMLGREQLPLVHRAMRSYFACWLQAGFRPVAMPSRLVDAYWHAFILDTRAYAGFCETAFGRFFHHVPAAVASQAGDMGEAMQRTWRLCCAQELIPLDAPAGVPLLFMIDERIGVPDAMRHDIESLRKASMHVDADTLSPRKAPTDSNASSSGCGGANNCGGSHRSDNDHGDSDGGGNDGGDGGGGGCGGD